MDAASSPAGDIALVVVPSASLRRVAQATLVANGWVARPFTDPLTAFHYACRYYARVGAALVDEAIGARPAELLVRRLVMLRYALPFRVLVLPGRDPTLRALVAAQADDREDVAESLVRVLSPRLLRRDAALTGPGPRVVRLADAAWPARATGTRSS